MLSTIYSVLYHKLLYHNLCKTKYLLIEKIWNWNNQKVFGTEQSYNFTWVSWHTPKMMHKAWSRIEEVLYCFSRSSIKFQGHTALKIVEFFRVIHQISKSQVLKYQRFELNLSKITRPVAAIKSLRFALLTYRIMKLHQKITFNHPALCLSVSLSVSVFLAVCLQNDSSVQLLDIFWKQLSLLVISTILY